MPLQWRYPAGARQCEGQPARAIKERGERERRPLEAYRRCEVQTCVPLARLWLRTC